MFVKVYVYHIKKDKVEEYLKIQEKAGDIYGKYINSKTIYLQSNEDETKWMEITKYESAEEYNKSIESINQQKEIQELFKSFQAVLLEGKSEIDEENFTEIMS
jgi:hydroxymethylpyrimidine pyrophosphatase-like HAD family hydrolase